MDRYREKIIMSYLDLQSMRDVLMDSIINVAMSGEYKSISDSFSLGDSYEFDLLQFRDTDDASLNRLLDVYDEMDAAMDSLINLNVITEEEIEDVEKDWIDLMSLTDMYEDDDEDLNEDILADAEDWEDMDGEFSDFKDMDFKKENFGEDQKNGEDTDMEEDDYEMPF